MGASAWFYFVPYREDIAAALEELRWDVFRSGKYSKGYASDVPLEPYETWIKRLPPEYLAIAPNPRGEYDKLARRAARVPKTPDEAIKKAAEDGTHSVIDVTKVNEKPGFGVVSPMPESMRVERFGSARPTRGQVEQARHEIGSPAGRWSGYWLAVYADDGDEPRWLCFAGISGD